MKKAVDLKKIVDLIDLIDLIDLVGNLKTDLVENLKIGYRSIVDFLMMVIFALESNLFDPLQIQNEAQLRGR